VLAEPLLHFLVLGVALFAANAYLTRNGVDAATPKRIELTLDDLRQIAVYFQAQWRRPPTPDEFGALVENKIKQEVLYREALAMGLDKDDEIVRRRMAQKMQFIAEDVANAYEPSTTELRKWYDANNTKFAQPGRITFRQLYFSPDQRGTHAYDDAAKALQRLAHAPIDAKLVTGDPMLLQDYYGDRSSEQIAKDFGPSFATALFELTPGRWQGPIESGFGWHLVFVDSIVPGRIPAFEEIEGDVKTAWLGEQKAIAWQKAYDAMRAKYIVLIPKPPDDFMANAASANAPAVDASNAAALGVTPE
jgi:peptidyl-prolyl cis-trans isomerase C